MKNDLVYHQGQIIKDIKLNIWLLQHRYTCGRIKFDLVVFLEVFFLKVLVCSSENLVPLPSSFLQSTAWALPGHQGYLPCDIEAESAHEQLYTVLWYKGDDGEPIYTFDAHTSDQLGSTSTVQYTPLTDQDYGILNCWATNSQGCME